MANRRTQLKRKRSAALKSAAAKPAKGIDIVIAVGKSAKKPKKSK